MGLNCIPLCRVLRPYPTPLCHPVLQGYPGEPVRSSGMDITLDNVLTFLDEHYNNVKALDVLNQELVQLQMDKKETVLDWGFIYQGTSKFWLLHSQSTSPLIMWLS